MVIPAPGRSSTMAGVRWGRRQARTSVANVATLRPRDAHGAPEASWPPSAKPITWTTRLDGQPPRALFLATADMTVSDPRLDAGLIATCEATHKTHTTALRFGYLETVVEPKWPPAALMLRPFHRGYADEQRRQHLNVLRQRHLRPRIELDGRVGPGRDGSVGRYGLSSPIMMWSNA